MASQDLRSTASDATQRHKMILGRQPPFCGYGPREHAPYDYELQNLYWPKPYARFFDRIDIYRRHRSGPRPWAPGRYRTSKWQPWSGFSRFSGLRETLDGAYHAARYTGEHCTPEHYIRRHHGEEAYQRQLSITRRKKSWRLSSVAE